MGGDTEKSGRDIDHVTPASQLLGKEVRDQSAFNNASSTSINNVEFESTQHPFAIDLKAPIGGQRAQGPADHRGVGKEFERVAASQVYKQKG